MFLRTLPDGLMPASSSASLTCARGRVARVGRPGGGWAGVPGGDGGGGSGRGGWGEGGGDGGEGDGAKGAEKREEGEAEQAPLGSGPVASYLFCGAGGARRGRRRRRWTGRRGGGARAAAAGGGDGGGRCGGGVWAHLEKRERLVCVRVLKLQHVEVELARLEGVVGDEAATRAVDLVRRVRVDRP